VRNHRPSGPAHRWTLTVMLLVSLASLPTLAAISAGSVTLGQGTDPDSTTPFIAQPSGVPVVIVPQPPTLLPPPEVGGEAAATYGRRPAAAKPQVRDYRPARRPTRVERPRVVASARPGRVVRPHIERGRARPLIVGPDTQPHPACKRPALGWRPLLPQVPTPRCQ
jgi:hypothetical protein